MGREEGAAEADPDAGAAEADEEPVADKDGAGEADGEPGTAERDTDAEPETGELEAVVDAVPLAAGVRVADRDRV